VPGVAAPGAALSLADWEQTVHPDDLGPTWKRVREHLEARTPRIDCEFRVRDPSGSWIWLRARGVAVERDGDGRAVKVAGTMTDVSEARASLDGTIASERLATAALLAARLAHEVNTPLTWMTSNLGYVQEALQSTADGAAPSAGDGLVEAIEETQRGASRIHDVVESLRRAAEPIRSGPTEPFEVRPHLLEAIAAARDEIIRRAKLTVAIEEPLAPVMSRDGDLKEMFLHLLRNAAQAIPEGSPEANEVRVAASVQSGQVVVDVSDTGFGMSSRVRTRMFDPFFTTRGAEGAIGLGATVARAVAEAAGGCILVGSDLDRGTTVRVLLPAAVESKAAP
jgi:signal transduction histidine kinase